MTPAQMRMARAALRIEVRKLAEMAGTSPATITRFENERGGLNADTRDRLQKALEDAGVVFTPPLGERGPCVCLKTA